jgi:Fe-S-cluster containining protein
MPSKDRSVNAYGGKNGAARALPSLVAYRALLEKLDSHAKRLRARYREHIACAEGCAGCCSLSSVFAVEACSMVLSADKRRKLFGRAAFSGASLKPPVSGEAGRCPFLFDDRCLVYDARPVICRTHGYPLLVEGNVDYCPKNFTTLRTIESRFILDLDALNTLLASINIAFTKENKDRRFSRERIGIRDLWKMLGA